MSDPSRPSPYAVPLADLERATRVPLEAQVVGVPVSAAAAYLALGLVPWADGGHGADDGE